MSKLILVLMSKISFKYKVNIFPKGKKLIIRDCYFYIILKGSIPGYLKITLNILKHFL